MWGLQECLPKPSRPATEETEPKRGQGRPGSKNKSKAEPAQQAPPTVPVAPAVPAPIAKQHDDHRNAQRGHDAAAVLEKVPSYNLNPLMRKRYEEVMDAKAFSALHTHRSR